MWLQKRINELLFKKSSKKVRQAEEKKKKKTGDESLDIFSEENLNKIKPEEKDQYDEIKRQFKS